MQIQKNNYRARLIVFGLILLALFFLYQMGFTSFLTVEYIETHIDRIRTYVNEHYATSIALYITLFSLGVACSLPFGILLPILGGMLLGWIPGTICSVISATIGGTIAFLVSRYLIGNMFQQRFGERLAQFNNELDQYGYLYLLGLHFFPVTPFFVLNILSGLTTIPLFTFVWTTVVGVAPAFSIYSFIGTRLASLSQLSLSTSTEIIIAFIALKILSATTLIIGRFGKRWFSSTK
jgi:uncharacterized membrane protein YdjX (TVP38/TMEM64 family)